MPSADSTPDTPHDASRSPRQGCAGMQNPKIHTLDDLVPILDRQRAEGRRIVFTEDIVYSSSALIIQYMSQYPDHVREYLGDFAARYPAEDVLAPLRAAENLRVLVVGETIIDEYAYCEAIGKSGKEPVLATRYLGVDRFGGGVLACANHAAGFARSVDVLTQLGEGLDEEEFVRGVLKPNVTPHFLEKPGAPTIVKQRFVEHYLSQKMFEVYR